MRAKLRYIDLFAGCGGLSEGFDSVGRYEGVAHVEWEKAPLETLRTRLRMLGVRTPEALALRYDIQNIDGLLSGGKLDDVFDSGAGLLNLCDAAGGVDLVIGGPPCQAYSIAGRVRDDHGMHFDYRNYLFESYLAIVHALRPKAVVFENVPGMLSAAPGGISIRNRVVEGFRNAGYEVLPDLRNCIVEMNQYGLPQRRKRVIIVGLSKEHFGSAALSRLHYFYKQVLPSQRTTERTVEATIGDLPRLLPTKDVYRFKGKKFSHTPADSGVLDHSPRFHSLRDQAIFRDLAEDAQKVTPSYSNVTALQRLYTERTGRTSAVHKYYVLRRDEPSNLIPAHLFKDGLRHIHFDPEQARSITVREAAMLQGFPADFVFVGSQGDKYKMIGNAVPPLFSKKLALAVEELITEKSDRGHNQESVEKQPNEKAFG